MLITIGLGSRNCRIKRYRWLYLILMKDREQQNVENYNHLHFWDVTGEDVHKQFEELFIEIEWNC